MHSQLSLKISQSFKSDESSYFADSPFEGASTLDTFKNISDVDLGRIIMSGNSKSCHLDPLPTALLKDVLDCLLPTLLKLVNVSLSSSTVPASLKCATVTPFLKKQGLDSEDMKNYRPVSNLPYVSKLIEKAVVAQLNQHMSDNSLYESHESAYRKCHSTETALVKIMDDLLCAVDDTQCALLVMLDQSAAFDTVNQDILLHRLESTFGITGSSLSWLRSYFKGRTQAVTISGASSKPKALTTGFPQGSILGPYKYPMYTAPLFTIARKYNICIHMYADDTQLYVSFKVKDSSEAMQRLRLCIDEIRKWMVSNHLKLNNTKTEFLVIGSPHAVKKLDGVSSIVIGEDVVDATACAKNIGAIIDSRLSMSDHVNSVCRACYMHLRHISQIRPFLTEEASATMVQALITSKLDYVNSLLFGLPDYLIRRLELIQNNAARLVLRKKKRDHVMPLLKTLHWLPITQRIEFKINLLTYKALHGLAPDYISDLLEPYQPTRTLRSASKGYLQEKQARLKRAGDRAFSFCAPKLWNRLPENVTSCDTVESFKIALKTYFFRKVFNS
jgi:hypothetical protein